MNSDCYDLPQYWDLAFGEDTSLEADFILAAAKKYCDFAVTRLLEPGCGGGRLLCELARRGCEVTGWDLSAAAVEFANAQLKAESLRGHAMVADMTNAIADSPLDLAYCLVNTFRHLLTEELAQAHLQNVAASLRPGGLYIIGMHLFPPDADEEDEEEWSFRQHGVSVEMQLTVDNCDRAARREILKFQMSVDDPVVGATQVFHSEYEMRLYQAGQFEQLLKRVPAFRLLDVYDFWYDIDEPQMLSDELGDTVFILQRQPES